MLENKLTLTDDELNLVMTGLQIIIQSYEQVVAKGDKINFMDIKVCEDVKVLHNKLLKEYY